MRTGLEVFNDAADLYDQVRPGYPPALFQAIFQFSGIQAGGSVLEIGCGTGQATRSLARAGFQVTCVEAGVRLAELAALNFRKNPEIKVHQAYFEEWPLPTRPFDLAVSATAFHHVETKLRFSKTAEALKPGGTIALFWNWPGTWEANLRRKIQAVYETYLPEDARNFDQSPIESRVEKVRRDLDLECAEWFQPLQTSVFPWAPAYTAGNYLKLLETYSGGHQFLEPERKARFFSAISDIVESRGGSIETPLESALFIARKLK